MQNNELYIEKLHSDILTIMDEIDCICKKNSLRYYLAGGSCLGALRHKGFIPWDDDLDILMPYDDFKKFISIIKDELDERFYLKWFTTDKNYTQDFAKVCLKGTLFVEGNCKECNHLGIFVDVFPMYPSNKYSIVLEIKKKIINFLHAALCCKMYAKLSWRWNYIPRNILSICINGNTIYKLMLCVIKPKKEDKVDYYACYPSTYPIKRQVFPKNWYRECVPLKFENREYWGAIESEKKMKFEYGDNFMELPPIEKRKTHYPSIVKFSDGQILKFPESKHKVSYIEVIS